MPLITIHKTLGLSATPAASSQGAVVTVDIGKYYDNSAVRISRAWCYATYEDITAVAAPVQANGFIHFQDTTLMQLPAASITTTSGVAALAIGSLLPIDSGQYPISGDAILTSPTFDIQITGNKKAVGGYPAAFQFFFLINIQFQFDFRNLSEEILAKL